MRDGSIWAPRLSVAGWIAMLAGAVDPLEGSVLIFLGSGLVALGARLGHLDDAVRRHRLWTFGLITFGVAAVWAFSAAGGFGGPHGLPMAWAILVLPYPAGWLLSLLDRTAPRWFFALAAVVGLWYVALPVIAMTRLAHEPPRAGFAPLIAIGIWGVLTIGTGVMGLRRRPGGGALAA